MGVRVEVEQWLGIANLTTISLDDFKMILGVVFLIAMKAISMPHFGVVNFMEDGSSCMVSVAQGEPSKEKKQFPPFSSRKVAKRRLPT